jgi:hypothetical protein
MEKLTHYRAIVRQIMAEQAQITPGHGQIETILMDDECHDQYLLAYLGWSGYTRHDEPVIHLRLRDEKIWIERDGTREGMATALLAAGVPADDIVLGFLHPSERARTEFAVA